MENSVKTQKQANSLSRRAIEAGETLYEVAETSDTAAADLHPEHRGRTPNSLLTILGWLGTAYRLGRTRYRQRRQLLETDDR